jgi:nucleoside-diphosphate-sugar epimerase
MGWPVIVLRLAGIYGPGRGYWLNRFLAGTARLEDDGQRVLNMIHRDDVVGAALHVLEQGPAGETYNVVDDEPVTQLEFYKWLAGELKQALPPSGDASEGLKRRGTNKRVSNRKLRRLGWRPKYATFREGMKSLLDQSPV